MVYPFNIKENMGECFLPHIEDINSHLGYWRIFWAMLTPNKPSVPDYKPKKIKREYENT